MVVDEARPMESAWRIRDFTTSMSAIWALRGETRHASAMRKAESQVLVVITLLVNLRALAGLSSHEKEIRFSID
jgi:hypothetical protein